MDGVKGLSKVGRGLLIFVFIRVKGTFRGEDLARSPTLVFLHLLEVKEVLLVDGEMSNMVHLSMQAIKDRKKSVDWKYWSKFQIPI